MQALVKSEPNPNVPELRPGDTVKVSIKIAEKTVEKGVETARVRNQLFQGVVIKVKKGGSNASYTVRRVAYGIGVERTFFVASHAVDKVEVLRHGKVRRARLYYLRGLTAKKARITERRSKVGGVAEQPEQPEQIEKTEQ
jgi:large subunit ribosomal protein L19